MNEALIIAAAWLIFGGLHLLPGRSGIRLALVSRWGERNYVLLYTVLAALLSVSLAVATAQYGRSGIAGLDLASRPPFNWLLGLLAFLGAVLACAGLLNYPRSPVAQLIRQQRNARVATLAISSIDRVSRHPFFIGVAGLMGAHALLASHLSGAVFFAGFALLAVIGIPLQDSKLRRRHGDQYENYYRESALIQFPTDVLWRSWRMPLVAALVLLALHPLWEIGHGAFMVVLLAAGATAAVLKRIGITRSMANRSRK